MTLKGRWGQDSEKGAWHNKNDIMRDGQKISLQSAYFVYFFK